MSVRSLSIALPDARQIDINGVVYDILVSDFEAMELAVSLSDRLGGLDASDTAAVVAVIRFAIGIVDDILGEGAVKRILCGRPANLNYLMDSVIAPILTAVSEECSASYKQKIVDEYE